MELEVSLGTGHGAAGCRGCGRVFTSDTAFGKHQRLRDGEPVCLDPAEVGLERKPTGRWGWKGSAARTAQFSEGASHRDANRVRVVSQHPQEISEP